MRPIVSSINSITYALARHLTDLLKPLVEESKTHIQNAKDLVDKLLEVEIEEGEVLTSFDVTALFTSVPNNEVVEMVVKSSNKDSTEEFGELLLMVVEITYFRFQGKIFEQPYGMSVGSPLSLGLSNLFIEEFEDKALASNKFTKMNCSSTSTKSTLVSSSERSFSTTMTDTTCQSCTSTCLC